MGIESAHQKLLCLPQSMCVSYLLPSLRVLMYIVPDDAGWTPDDGY